MHNIQATVIINAPEELCYQTWADLERLPQIMSRVTRVYKVADEGRIPTGDTEGEVWHWEVKGPLGKIYDWRAAVVLDLPNKAISWAPVSPMAEDEHQIATSGSVNFLQQNEAQTLLETRLTYAAPAPPFGELVADVLHLGDNLVDEALQEFKLAVERRYLETIPDRLLAEAAAQPPMHNEAEVREQTGTPRTVPPVRSAE